MKLLVDECLSPQLVKLARERGYGESSHVVWVDLDDGDIRILRYAMPDD